MPAKKVTLTDSIHSKVGPSSSERWMNCPASVRLADKIFKAQGYHPVAGEAAREGTAAHSVLAACLQNGKEAWEYAGQLIVAEGQEFEVDEAMVSALQMALDFCRKMMEEHEDDGAVLYVESLLSSALDEEAFGTGDVVIVVPKKKIIIADFKYGRGVPVEPQDSQLKLYAYFTWEMYGGKYFPGMDNVPVDQWIMQPRIPHPRGEVRSWTTDTKTLEAWFMTEGLAAMAETRNPDAVFKVGEWCRFCPANKKCPALLRDALYLEVNRDPISLDEDELGDLIMRLEVLQKFAAKLEEEALSRARQGRKVRGFKLVHKQANRIFRNEVVLLEPDPFDPDGDGIEVVRNVEEMIKARFGDAAYSTPALLGPAVIEKLRDGNGATGKDLVARCAYKPDTGTTLAPDSDKRQEVRPLLDRVDVV